MKITKELKAIFIAIPVSFLIYAGILWLLNGKDIWLGVPIGFFVYEGILWSLMTPEERLTWKARTVDSWKNHGSELAIWSWYLGVGLFFHFAIQHIPTVSAVKSIFNWVSTIAVIAVMLYAAYVVVTTSVDRMLQRFFTVLLKGFAVYELVLWGISSFGDSLYHKMIASPEKFAIVGVSMWLGWIILRFSFVQGFSLDNLKPRHGDAQFFKQSRQSARPAIVLTPEVRLHIATHEIGHALTCAALPKIPEELKVTLNIGGSMEEGELFQYEGREPLGCVTGTPERRMMETETLTLWRMHLCLAGCQAERFMYGQDILGGSEDYEKWLILANNYLLNLKQGIYYPSPKNALEKESNEAQMMQLKGHQEKMLDSLFIANKSLMEEMVVLLLEKRRLYYADLQPFLDRVALPVGFQKPDFA